MAKSKNNTEREAAQQRAQEQAAQALGGLSLGSIDGDDLGTISAGNEAHIEEFADKNFAAPKGQILSNDTRWIEVEKLDDNPDQPRTYMELEALNEMIDGMNAVGQIHPILVRPHPTRKGRFQVAAGHRRKEAVRRGANAGKPGPHSAQFLGKVHCEVRELSDFEMLIIAGQENLARADLPLLDQANYYQKVYQALGAGWAEVEKITGIKYRHMKRVIAITGLPEAMLGKFSDGTLNERHARALLELQNATIAQNALFRAIVREELSGTQAEKRAKEMKAKAANPASKKSASNSDSGATGMSQGHMGDDAPEPQNGTAETSAEGQNSDMEEARKYLQCAIDIFERIGDRRAAARTRGILDDDAIW